MDARFFEEADYTAVTKIVAASVEETHGIEFKRKSSPSDRELNKDDRRLLGEALSGFANATGGLLLLGIGTENHQGVDRAKDIFPIANVSVVADRYRSYAAECVSPPVSGVQVRAVANEDGSGVIVIKVPQGQSRPHMSTAPGHHTYYRRVMDAFVPMQHYEVEEMMRLKTKPKLTLLWELRSGGSIGTNRIFHLMFGLRNESRMTAKFPFISYLDGTNQPSVAQYGLDGNGNTLWPRLSAHASPSVTFAGGADKVIHPGQGFFVSKLDFNETYDPRFMRDWGYLSLHPTKCLRFALSSDARTALKSSRKYNLPGTNSCPPDSCAPIRLTEAPQSRSLAPAPIYNSRPVSS